MTTDVQTLINSLRKVQSAPEPGSKVHSLRDIQKAEGEGLSAEVLGVMVKSAGYFYYWDTVTGERRIGNNNMILAQFRKRRPDGELAFCPEDPHIVLSREKHLCLLHKDAPDRKQYDRMGLPVCVMASIPNEYEVTRHMKTKHKSAWAAVQAMKEKEEKQRAESFQRDLLAKMSRAMEAGAGEKGRGRPKKGHGTNGD